MATNRKKSRKRSERFAIFCDEWLESSRNYIKPSTYNKYRQVLEKHIKPYFGKNDLYLIDTKAVDDFKRMLLEIKELSPKTVRDVLTILRAVINYSSKQLPDLPIIHFHFPKIFQKEMRVLAPGEQKHLVEYLLSELDDCRLGILLALFTGMRIGELCALRWENVSIKEKSIKICHTVQRLQNNDKGALTRTKLCFGDPKSDKSYRVIPIPDKLICLCKKMMKSDLSSYVLTGSEKPMDPRTLQYRLEKYTRICGIEGIHFHTLRHSFATRCIEAGFELKCLSEVLGHASTSITLDRYVHSSLELKRTNMNKLPFPAP